MLFPNTLKTCKNVHIYRGEKLYVTKDKRHPPTKRKCMLCTMGLALSAGILLIIALVACEYLRL